MVVTQRRGNSSIVEIRRESRLADSLFEFQQMFYELTVDVHGDDRLEVFIYSVPCFPGSFPVSTINMANGHGFSNVTSKRQSSPGTKGWKENE